MYIKREPLGRGNLTFGKRRRRFPLGWIVLYLFILAAALVVYLRADVFQPRVLAMIGPEPAPTTTPAELTEMAQTAYMDGDIAQAIEYYRQAAEIDPMNAGVLTDLAFLLVVSGERTSFAEAVTIAEQAILIAPEDPRGYAAKARALDWLGDYPQAQNEALRAIELDSNYALGHAVLAEVYADMGRLRQAREQAEIAIQLDPYNVDVRRNYALVLEYYGDYQGAIQQYIQATQLHPKRIDLLYGLARNYRGAGQTDAAIQIFERIGQMTPYDPILYMDLGKTYMQIRDDAAAQEMFEQAVWLVCRQGQLDEGVAEEDLEPCPYVTGDTLFDEDESWYLRPERDPRPSQIPWDADHRDVPPQVLILAWTRLGNTYLMRRNYEDAIAILAEAIAWGEAQDEDDPNYQDIPIETYYVMATAYYYNDLCRVTVPMAVQSLEIYQERYEEEDREDLLALKGILSLFVLCRDFSDHSITYEGPGFANGFPEGYEEPDVRVERGGSDE